MPGPVAALVAGAILALVGWAAWTLSGGFTAERAKPETPFQRGLNALLRGDREEALRAFAITVKEDSDNIDAYIHLGNLLREQGEVEKAHRLHRELTVRPGLTGTQQRSARESLILDLIALDRPTHAVEEGLRLRDADRKDPGALKVLLQALEAAKEWERAIEIYSELARLNGEHSGGSLARYRAAIGESLLREGRTDEAKKHLKEALRLERNQPGALLRLGDIYYARARAERAVVLWKGLAAAHPDKAHLVLDRLESAYFERGRFGEMGVIYEELLSRSPRDVRILVALARMHVKKGDLAEASRVLAEALEIEPDSLAARLLLVNVYRRRGELSRALDEMETLLRSLDGKERFACATCGTAADEYWTRCPACFAWAAEA
ncbi:MAG: tetratricopeptide repeat protein [Candidatus Latescibacteria bacterium]|nr:tetratricopeptide repeat protein [Candidatus Latescibacterota bacterium]